MRRLLIAAAAAVLAAAPAHALPTPTASASTGPVAHAACVSATVGGQRKCIARGQYCARAYQPDYRRYGFSCSKRDARGRYHLV